MKRLAIVILAAMVFMAGDAFSADMDLMMPVLKEAKKNINGILASADKDLLSAAKKLSGLDLKSDEARNVMRELSKDKHYLIDTVIVDLSGKDDNYRTRGLQDLRRVRHKRSGSYKSHL